jgi:KUP system potassium uptake protein
MPLDQYMREIKPREGDANGTMVFLTGDQHGVPFMSGKHAWVRERAERERIVLLTLVRAARPYVPESERVRIDHISNRLSLVTASFGYMDRPSVKPIVAACGAEGLHLEADTTSFFYADPKLTRADDKPLMNWQRGYFAFLTRNARPLPDDLGIDPERRIELGVGVAM